MPARKRRRGFAVTRTAKRSRAATPRYSSRSSRRLAALRLLNTRTGGYIGLERKFLDTEQADDSIGSSWTGGELDPTTFLCLSAVAQGDGENQRDGRRYEVHSVHVSGFVEASITEAGAAPATDTIVKIAMVLDKQTNGAQLNAEDVYVTGQDSSPNTFRNLQFTQRFQILRSKMFNIRNTFGNMNEGAVNSFATGGVKVPFAFNYQFDPPLQVNTKNTTAVIASITDNSIHIIGSATGSIATELSYQARIRFTG